MEDASLSKRETQLEAIRAKCREFKQASFDNATLREEQEHELSPEIEQERQVERPLALAPYNHSVHRDVKRFVHQGIIDYDSDAFQPAFELSVTRAPTNVSNHQHLDSFLRPVHWVASAKNVNMVECVVLSPYEAHT